MLLCFCVYVAMGHNLWRSHFGVDEHPCTTYFDVHQEYSFGFDPQPCVFSSGTLFRLVRDTKRSRTMI